MKYVKEIYELLRDTANGFSQDRGSLLAAALAYYTVFSIAPLVVIVVAIVGRILGEAATVEGQLVSQIGGVVGTDVAEALELLITSINTDGDPGGAWWATVISVIILLIGASSVFTQLKVALNTIWGIAPHPNEGILDTIKNRFLSFGMILVIGFLLLVSLLSNTLLGAINHFWATHSPEWVVQIEGWLGQIGLNDKFDLLTFMMQLDLFARLQFVFSFGLITLLFAWIFKILPDAKIAWRDVWLGAVVTAVLFTLGEYLIGLYLVRSSVGSPYGAAGSLVVLLIWVYYSAQILLFGAEFTEVYAIKHGSKIIPKKNSWIRTYKPYEPEPEIILPAVIEEEILTADPPRRQVQKQFATALIGLAFGLLLGFLGSLKRNR